MSELKKKLEASVQALRKVVEAGKAAKEEVEQERKLGVIKR